VDAASRSASVKEVRVWLVRVGHEGLAREVEGVCVLELLVAVAWRLVEVAPHVVGSRQATATDAFRSPQRSTRGCTGFPTLSLMPRHGSWSICQCKSLTMAAIASRSFIVRQRSDLFYARWTYDIA
jgi:hypothetical protein